MARTVKKKRITKHELKEDRFLETTKDFILFSRKNASRLILIIIVLLVAVVTVRVYFGNKRKAEENARIRILYANSLYENANFKEAVGAYQEIVNAYGGTKAGRIATLLMANSYFFSGDMDNALENYEKSLKMFKKDKNWGSASLMGIASVYEQKGSFDEAIKYYGDVISNYPDTPSRMDALESNARCLEFTNRYEEAIEVYSQIEHDYPETDFADKAENRITFLRGATESQRIEKSKQ